MIIKKKNRICIFKKKIKSVIMCKKNKKDFLRKGFHLCNKFMLCVLNKINTTIHDPFFISKSSMLNIYIYILDLHLMKT